MRHNPKIAVAAFALALAACAPDAPLRPEEFSSESPAFSHGGGNSAHSAEMNRTLAAVRAATARLHNTTEEELASLGYTRSSPCVPHMGIHFTNVGLIDEMIDPLQPEALLFLPKHNGGLKLVAVEYLATGDHRPSLLGVPFDEEQLPFPIPWKWELHAWIWQANPNGIFAPHNPNISCPTEAGH